MKPLVLALALTSTTAFGAAVQRHRHPPMSHGYGQLDYGHSIKGGKRYGAGEWRGGAIVGDQTTLDLAPGVVVRIPAKTPHVIRSLSSSPLIYLVLKEKVTASGTP